MPGTVAFALSMMFAAAQAPAAPEVDPVALGKLHEVAQCLVDDDPEPVIKLLRLDWWSVSYSERLRDRARSRSARKCLDSGRLGFDRLVFAGALAEATLERELAKQPGLVADARPKVIAEPIKARSATEVMALCSVLDNDAGVMALLATVPGSAPEMQQLKAMAPTLGKCLQSGAEAKLNAAGARSVLALATWRIVDQRGRGKD